MNKAELLALGFPEERLKEFQRLYHRDLRKAVQSADKEAKELRAATIPMLNAIKSPERLRLILATVSHHYLKEYQDNKKTAQGAANTRDGEAEQNSDELQCSASSVTKNEEDYK